MAKESALEKHRKSERKSRDRQKVLGFEVGGTGSIKGNVTDLSHQLRSDLQKLRDSGHLGPAARFLLSSPEATLGEERARDLRRTQAASPLGTLGMALNVLRGRNLAEGEQGEAQVPVAARTQEFSPLFHQALAEASASTAPTAQLPAAPLEPLALLEQALGPAPDRVSYVQPFDDAAAQARGVYDRSLPEITAAYEGLRSNVQGNQQQFAAIQARIAQEQAARQAAAQEQVAGFQQQGQQDLQALFGGGVAPSLASAIGAEQGQQRANLADQANRQNALAQELAASQRLSHESRIEDSRLAEQASLSNARTNLDRILGQLGVQRAKAEQEFVRDSQDHARESAKLQEQQVRDVLKEVEARQRELNRTLTTPRQEFDATDNARWERNPRARRVMQKILDERGPRNLGEAMEDLDEVRDQLVQQGLRPEVIEAWFRMYFDRSTKAPSKRKAQELGIDIEGL